MSDSLIQPTSRTESYLYRMATGAGTIPPTPCNRKETYYSAIIEHLDTKADLVSGKVPASQLPSYVDDIVEGYYYNNKFYSDSAHTQEITAETGKIYIDLSSNKTYRWGGSTYVQVGGGGIEYEEVV